MLYPVELRRHISRLVSVQPLNDLEMGFLSPFRLSIPSLEAILSRELLTYEPNFYRINYNCLAVATFFTPSLLCATLFVIWLCNVVPLAISNVARYSNL